MAFFGVKFILQKFCLCKKKWQIWGMAQRFFLAQGYVIVHTSKSSLQWSISCWFEKDQASPKVRNSTYVKKVPARGPREIQVTQFWSKILMLISSGIKSIPLCKGVESRIQSQETIHWFFKKGKIHKKYEIRWYLFSYSDKTVWK